LRCVHGPANGPTFTGRPGADQLSNDEDRFAGPVQCSVGLSGGRTAITVRIPDLVNVTA
jgi:hypothetical protein